MTSLVFWPVLLLGVCGVSAQSSVAEIDRDAAVVQRTLSSLKRDSVELTGYSSEGGLAVIYRDSASAVRLIHVHLFGESGQSVRDFYFRDGALALCLEERQTYNIPINITDSMAKEFGTEAFDPKKTQVVHDRYYFRDGRMIRWQNNAGVLIAPEVQEFRDTGQNVLSFATELMLRFR